MGFFWPKHSLIWFLLVVIQLVIFPFPLLDYFMYVCMYVSVLPASMYTTCMPSTFGGQK